MTRNKKSPMMAGTNHKADDHFSISINVPKKFRKKFRNTFLKTTALVAFFGAFLSTGMVETGFTEAGIITMLVCVPYLTIFLIVNRNYTIEV